MVKNATRLAGVMGWPVGHSLSPRLHGHWLRRYGIDGAYLQLPIAPADLPLLFQALPKAGFLGWNVTIPHKEAAFALVDCHDAAAQRTGVVNTVLVHPDGRLEGRSTDGYGFMANLKAAVPDWRAGQGPGVILGAGGAARAIGTALLEAGAAEIRIVNRSRARAEALAAHLSAIAPAVIQVVAWEERAPALSGAALLVNTTSLGMQGQPPLDLVLDSLPGKAIVTDIVYVPLQTGLLHQAAMRGNPTVDGLGMLLHQAVPGFSWWGGVVPEVDAALRDDLLAALATR